LRASKYLQRVQGIGVNAAIKTGADGTAFGTTKLAAETGEATGLLAKFDGKDGWYAVDPISGQPYGSKLNGFLPQESPRSMGGFFDRTPSTPPDPDMPARFQVNVIKAKYGKPTEYMNGYKTTIAPTSVPGYSATMDIKKIETLIANSTLESEQIGSLMRRRDQLILDVGNGASGSRAVKCSFLADAGLQVRQVTDEFCRVFGFRIRHGDCHVIDQCGFIAFQQCKAHGVGECRTLSR
jgi:hypothetical protein